MSEQLSNPASDDDQSLVSNNVVVLKHPNGTQIYLVGTAHVSEEACHDVETVISKVQPNIVVLELDNGRFERLKKAADTGDEYGITRYQTRSAWKIARMALTGEILPYTMGLVYVCIGSLMGSRPGGEFLTAASTAEQVGATIVLADRDQTVTLRRLAWYSQALRRHAERQRRQGASFPGQDQTSFPPAPGQRIGWDGRGGSSADQAPSQAELQAVAEVEANTSPDDPWGLGADADADDDSEAALQRRLLRMMREGGCERPDNVLEAAQRIFRRGLDSKGYIALNDVATVRQCGRTLVETFRRKAAQGDDAWMKQFETETVAGAKGAAGMQRSGQAMKKVIIDERDLILARRLYEAGLQAGSQPVVGVVGAGHLTGIKRMWSFAATQAGEERAAEFSSSPAGDRPNSALGSAVMVAGMGYVAWRRPKAAAFFLGAATLMTAPYLGFTIVSMKRFSTFAEKLVTAANELKASSGDDLGGGWGQVEDTDFMQ